MAAGMPARLLILIVAMVGLPAAPPAPPGNPCRGRSGAVVVRTGARTLSLCDGESEREHFPVALGAGGVGKRRAGDQRTPLGAYGLGAPRASLRYGTFVPVGYPTPEQARAGFTGAAIGIHGPPRAFVGAGPLNTATDWTAGCIAVGSDEEARRIADWVRAHPRPTVHID